MAYSPLANAGLSYSDLEVTLDYGVFLDTYVEWGRSSPHMYDPSPASDYYYLGYGVGLKLEGGNISLRYYAEAPEGCRNHCILHISSTGPKITAASLDQASIDSGLAAGFGVNFIPTYPMWMGTGGPDGIWLDLSGGFPSSNEITLKVSVVPEPETYAMLLAGLGLMGFVARRRKQA